MRSLRRRAAAIAHPPRAAARSRSFSNERAKNAPTSQTNPSSRRRRRLFWFLLLAIIPSLLIAISLIVGSQTGARGLEEAIARADNLDPHWRLADVEADRRPVPPEGKNGIDQLIAIHDALPMGYGLWSFPQFESQPDKLAAAREAMDKSLFDEHDPSFSTRNSCVLHIEQARARNPSRWPANWSISYGRFPLVYAMNFWGDAHP